MNKRNIITHRLIILGVCFFIIFSMITPVIAQEGKQYRGGTEDKGNGNNTPNSGGSDSPNDNPGSGNQQIGDNGGEGNGSKNQQQKQHHGENYWGQLKRYQYRKMNCTGDQKQYRICSQWNLNNSVDAFEIDFYKDPTPSLILNYMPNGNNSNIKLAFRITLTKIIEFEDINENERYDYNDVVISTYDFKSINFNNITYSNETTISGENVVKMTTQTIDDIFSLNMMMSDNFTSINNNLISPSEMKIDFIIKNYPYLNNNTQLALIVEVNTDHRVGVEKQSFDELMGFASNETSINISSINYSGFFSWLDDANIDGENKSVYATFFKENYAGKQEFENVSYIAISYPRGTHIIHDPKIGVISQSFASISLMDIPLINIIKDTSVYLAYILSCIFALLLFLGIIAIRNRIQ